MSDVASGITCPDTRRIVRAAIEGGWVWEGWTASTHGRLRWPATGDRITVACTPGSASWKSLATDVQRISGVQVWRKGNRKRSRKAPQLSGFSLDSARREVSVWDGAWGGHVEELRAQREAGVNELRALLARGDRGAALQARKVLDNVRHAEDELTKLHHPVAPFSMADLA